MYPFLGKLIMKKKYSLIDLKSEMICRFLHILGLRDATFP